MKINQMHAILQMNKHHFIQSCINVNLCTVCTRTIKNEYSNSRLFQIETQINIS